jgi:hypothetical protein
VIKEQALSDRRSRGRSDDIRSQGSEHSFNSFADIRGILYQKDTQTLQMARQIVVTALWF